MANPATQEKKVAKGDNKWVPQSTTLNALQSEGINVSVSADTDAVVAELNEQIVLRDSTDSVISVLIYTLKQREYSDQWIVEHTGNKLSESQVRDANRDGRCLVVSATPFASVNAARAAKLSIKEVMAVTDGEDKQENADAILKAATVKQVTAKAQHKGKRKADTKVVKPEQVESAYDEIVAKTSRKEQAPTVPNLLANSYEVMNLEGKERTATPPQEQGAQRPAVTLAAALKQANEIAATGTTKKYPMQQDDVKALADFLKGVDFSKSEREGLFDLIANQVTAVG